MRVVAGELRGRRIASPPGTETRPTTDKVREAIFNALRALDVVEGAHAVDLFAGTGALGIEALSRGAAHVTFVENRRPALRVLAENLRALDLTSRSTVVAADANRLQQLRLGHRIRRTSNGSDDQDGMAGAGVGLVFADPPYDFDGWDGLLEALASWAPVPFVVAESGRELHPPEPWVVRRARRYGRTWVTFCEIGEQ